MKAAAATLQRRPELILRTRTSALRFPEGLIGFPECKNFVLIEEEDIAPFRHLKSTDRDDVGFYVLNPECIRRNYLAFVSERDWESVDIKDPAAKLVLVICKLGSTLEQASGNLLAPLIINDANRTGRQIVLCDPFLTYRQPLLRAKTAEEIRLPS